MNDLSAAQARPLIVHVVYRFDVGGLENGVVNLINTMPADAYRHAVVALTDVTDFRLRIKREGVQFFALDKPPGHGFRIYPRLFSLFRALKPAIVHSRNLAALEAVVPAWLAGVPVRVHGEHGRDVGDLDGTNVKYQLVRRLYKPFVNHYVALSRDLESYLTQRIAVPRSRIAQLYNGVDVGRFRVASPRRSAISGSPFNDPALWLVGTVGRMQTVKDQTNLAHAFVAALQAEPRLRSRLRLVMVGDGPLRVKAQAILRDAGVSDLAWLPGGRDDIPEVLRGLDCFALPSLAEGISNTILEAMASGLPVIATAVGGNPELVQAGVTGKLVAAADAVALASAIVQYANEPERAKQHGLAGRAAVEKTFSLEVMTNAYMQLYDQLLGRAPGMSVHLAADGA